MSFLTCFCDLPQKEHFSRSPSHRTSPPLLSPVRSGPMSGAPALVSVYDALPRRRKLRLDLAAGDHLVDEAVFLRLLRAS